MQGLFLVATPIGNLGDITLRAIECLKGADRIYAEDTRRTKALLSHLGIEGKKLLSLHAHSPERAVLSATEILRSGESIALVTDAGMPSVSDPGTALVKAAREVGAPITCLPGPSAVTTAVALSGLVEGPFTFLGFLPRKGSKRARSLASVAASPFPVVLFESPHRVKETLADLSEVCGGERTVAVCREITKKFEETLVLTLAELTADGFRESWLGELTLVVAGTTDEKRETEEGLDIEARVQELLSQGESVKDVSKTVCEELSRRGEKVSRREIYARVLALSESSCT